MSNLSRSFTRWLHLQIFLGIVAYAVAEGNAALGLVAGTLSGLSYFIVAGPNGRPLPPWMLNVGVLGATAWLLISLDLFGDRGQVLVLLHNAVEDAVQPRFAHVPVEGSHLLPGVFLD